MVQIQFYGLKTVSEDRARGIVSARLWAPYPASAQAADIAAILGSGLFTGVSLRTVALSSAALRVDFDLTEEQRAFQQAVRDSGLGHFIDQEQAAWGEARNNLRGFGIAS